MSPPVACSIFPVVSLIKWKLLKMPCAARFVKKPALSSIPFPSSVHSPISTTIAAFAITRSTSFLPAPPTTLHSPTLPMKPPPSPGAHPPPSCLTNSPSIPSAASSPVLPPDSLKHAFHRTLHFVNRNSLRQPRRLLPRERPPQRLPGTIPPQFFYNITPHPPTFRPNRTRHVRRQNHIRQRV